MLHFIIAVIINDINLKIALPAYILENVDNYLHINLNVTADPSSADIAGTGLWRSPYFEIRDRESTVASLNATGNYWTSIRENVGECHMF